MKINKIIIIAVGIIILILLVTSLFPGDEKYSLTAPNGLSFGIIKGYENWQLISSHFRTDNKEIRFLLGNNIAISAYKKDSGQNGTPFPDGTILVQIGYSVKEHPEFKNATEPDVLQRVEYMIKDSKRFDDTGGWGFASFSYDSNTSRFRPFGNETFANNCFACHTLVKKKDYVFTDYANR